MKSRADSNKKSKRSATIIPTAQINEPIVGSIKVEGNSERGDRPETRQDTINYRNIAFKTKDLIDMRVLIHHKIEQVLDRASLWTKIMPQKIFSDLVHFIAENNGIDMHTLTEHDNEHSMRESHSKLTKSIDVGMASLLSLSKISKDGPEYKAKEQTTLAPMILVPQLQGMR